LSKLVWKKQWLNLHSSWTASHCETGSVTCFKMPSKSWTENRLFLDIWKISHIGFSVFSLTFSIQDISMFITFRFYRDWEFSAVKIQAQVWRTSLRRGFWKDVGSIGVNFWCGVQPARRGVFLTYWLNAASSDPTSWKCVVVRCPHRCPKIPALVGTSTYCIILYPDFRKSMGGNPSLLYTLSEMWGRTPVTILAFFTLIGNKHPIFLMGRPHIWSGLLYRRHIFSKNPDSDDTAIFSLIL
jgi:hypothetical protein